MVLTPKHVADPAYRERLGREIAPLAPEAPAGPDLEQALDLLAIASRRRERINVWSPSSTSFGATVSAEVSGIESSDRGGLSYCLVDVLTKYCRGGSGGPTGSQFDQGGELTVP